MARFLPTLAATRLQATTYLLGIALFSIAFLVFLNSSISFVVTDVIGRTHSVGDAVGTLGFADELLALVACPVWGLLSDRIGVRTVAVLGYAIVGVSLVALVQSREVYPDLLMGRLGFSIGGAACSTMVTAVLPTMVTRRSRSGEEEEQQMAVAANRDVSRLQDEERPSRDSSRGHMATASVSSELTITPGRYQSQSRSRSRHPDSPPLKRADKAQETDGTSQLAGFVGMFTGIGALVALAVFLPLPAYFQKRGSTPAAGVQYSFYLVGAVAFAVAVFIFFGLRDLPGEKGKSITSLWRTDKLSKTKLDDRLTPQATHSYLTLLTSSLKLGFTDPSIGLGYVGGFVARASSVGISLFIPLFVNAYFVRQGLCKSNPHSIPDIKDECAKAYLLASGLSGIAETAALICAPLFGWLGGRVADGKAEWPLLGASVMGILGYVGFGLVKNPDAFHGGDKWAMLSIIAIGISQIGAIVCSLALLGRGINSAPEHNRPGTADTLRANGHNRADDAEAAPLLSESASDSHGGVPDRSQLKGSIAGIYSLAGGAGILLLTKLGGVLFDRWTPGAPFFMLAIFNAILFLAVAAVGCGAALRRRRGEPEATLGAS
ncbi:hypothetical protein B0A48_02079 [Cryoendolithus antarcticus]|uniref:Major facilitator superfamily (MFS) profile domain-containing protein n=1 Tax=Cryoendolithus antarcticus TaxID=1507870 RepID=A0A1V8TML4_9PEZI|nr:hypothetical protein B0A48_02079 [Cryoendolithus antarcticus]